MEDIKIANFGDEDIKIAGTSPKRSAEDEVKDTFDELIRAKSDGNLNAITELGKRPPVSLCRVNIPL